MQRAHLVTRKRLAVEDGDAADLAQPVLYGQHVHGEGEGGARGKGWNRDFSQTKRDDRRFRVAGQQHAAALYSACASILDGQNQVKWLLDENGCCVGGSSRHILVTLTAAGAGCLNCSMFTNVCRLPASPMLCAPGEFQVSAHSTACSWKKASICRHRIFSRRPNVPSGGGTAPAGRHSE